MSREPIFVFVRSVPSAHHYALQFMEALVDHTIVFPPEIEAQRSYLTGEWAGLTLKSETDERQIHIINSEILVKRYYHSFEWLVATTHGAMLIVDSAMTTRERFRDVLSLLENYRGFKWGIPMVMVAVNCQHPEAWSVPDLRSAFRLSRNDSVPIVPCNVTDASSVLEIVADLVACLPPTGGFRNRQ